MARILLGIPPETEHSVTVLRQEKTVDTFTVAWRTPNDDDADTIKTVYLNMLTPLVVEDAQGDAFDQFVERNRLIKERRAVIDGIITAHFQRTTEEEYEDGDLARMLPHDIYRVALLESLWGVVTGVAESKNSETPGTTTEQDACPAAADVT